MFIVNPSGITIGVNDELGKELLKKPGFRKATEAEAVKTTPPPADAKIVVHQVTHKAVNDGYGESTLGMNAGLRASGIGLTSDKALPLAFVYGVPDLLDNVTNARALLFTMFESTSIPERWVTNLRRAWKVLVPSKFCQAAFATKGIQTEVVPIGYNEQIFKPIERPVRPVFTFLHYNAFNVRKGFDLVFKAFTELFGDDPNVRLVMKTVRTELPFPILKSEYPNIDVIKGPYTQAQMATLLGECDCLVFPSRGEGMGLPPLECMATGMPVITTNGTGMAEYATPKYFHLVDVERTIPAIYNNYDAKDVGDFVEPSLDSLKAQMMRVYEHQEEARAMAAKGAKYVAKYYTMTNTCNAVAAHINEMRDEQQVVDNLVENVANMLKTNVRNQPGGLEAFGKVIDQIQAIVVGKGDAMDQVPAVEVKAPAEPPRKAGRPPKAETKVADPPKRVDKQFGAKKPIKKRG